MLANWAALRSAMSIDILVEVHRLGQINSYTPDAMRYLTLDNVMDDAVKMIKEIQANVSGAANSRAIVASGSYGAYLATAFRLNRPETIYGAIAAAPPVDVFITADGVVPGRFNWWNWVRLFSVLFVYSFFDLHQLEADKTPDFQCGV